MINIEEIQELVRQNKFQWRRHCLTRMLERQITENEVIKGLLNGKIIEQYEDDLPWPSCLVYSKQENKCIHIVVAKEKNIQIYIITVYEPSLKKFKEDLINRKKE